MLRVIRSLLLKIVDDIDAGNSNISEGEALEIVDSLKRFTDKEKRLSKYAACKYLNVSRATFDNYVREGKLPRGKHEIGFKELSWSKKELDEFVKKYIGQKCKSEMIERVDTKQTASFRKLRGVMSSKLPYKEMVEDALKEKYSL